MSAFANPDYSYAEADPAETTTPPIPQGESMSSDADASHGHSNNPLLSDNPLVSDLEQEVLDEYARLLRNVNQVRRDDPLALRCHSNCVFFHISWTPRGNAPNEIVARYWIYRLLINALAQLSDKLADLAGSPASMPLDGLRLLERKTATVCTLLKASVYSIVLQQQIWNENEEQQQQSEDQHFHDHEVQHGGYEGEGDMTFQ